MKSWHPSSILTIKFILLLSMGGISLSFLAGPLPTTSGGGPAAHAASLLVITPGQEALPAMTPTADLSSLAAFFTSWQRPIIWHREDAQAFYHLILRPTATAWQATWQVIHRSPPQLTKEISDTLTLSPWASGPHQDLALRNLHFTFPKIDADGVNIIWREGQVKLYWQLTIMNYNVQNLWDHDPHNTDPRIMLRYELFQQAKSNWYDPAIQQQVAQNFKQVLLAAGLPDIVALQEIESANNQSKIFTPSSRIYQELTKLGYQSFLLGPQEAAHPTAITTAVISRYPLQAYPSLILNAANLTSLPRAERRSFGRTARDMQVAMLDLGFARLALVVAHWPAQLSPRRPFDKNKSGPSAAIYHAHRLALEKFLACTKAPQPSTSFPQCWIKSTKKTTPPSKNSPVPPQIIILGDFNISLGHPALPGAPWINLWYTLPPEERWESVFQGAAKSLAHIFLEDSFLQRNHLQLRPQSFTVQRDFLLHPDHTPLRRQWLKTKRHGQNHYQFSGAGYSDHLPLQVAVAIWPTPPGRPLTTQWHKITPTPSSFSSPSSSSSPFSPLTTCPTLRETAINKRQIGRCFTVDFTAAPQTLKSAGVYRHNYVLVDGQKLYLVLAATGSAAQAPTAQNLCFNRHVLQKRGGRLVKAQGKLGFFKDGFALYIARVAHLHLDHLSRRKAEACSFRDEARP